MVGWHHQLNRQEFEQTLGDSEGQGSLVCCSLWGLKELRHNLELNNNRKETGALSFSWLCSVLFCEGEVAQLCLTLCDPMECSMPGFPVHHQLPELAQTHAHQVGDAIKQFGLLSSPLPPAFNLYQHLGLL